MAVSIPYTNLPGQHALLKEQLLAAIANVLDHGQFVLGPEVVEFEKRFAELCGTRFAIAVNSGTDALILALRAIGLMPGDEVITVPNSFVASTACIRLLGARPVFVDVGPDYNLDPSRVSAVITPRTRAVLPVHLTGQPCDMDAILQIAKLNRLHVIEDAAQAVLGEYCGQRTGSFGTIGCFSLHPLKTLNACGDGGVLTTDDLAVCERLRVMRNIGLRTRDDCVMWSHNSRLDTMQAAILLTKLSHVETWTERRRDHARFYRSRLSVIPEIQLPPLDPRTKPAYHTFVIQAERRDALREFLAGQGIGSAIHYPVPIHLCSAGKELGYGAGSFPVTEAQARRILSLPIYPELTPQQLDRICRTIDQFYRN